MIRFAFTALIAAVSLGTAPSAAIAEPSFLESPPPDVSTPQALAACRTNARCMIHAGYAAYASPAYDDINRMIPWEHVRVALALSGASQADFDFIDGLIRAEADRLMAERNEAQPTFSNLLIMAARVGLAQDPEGFRFADLWARFADQIATHNSHKKPINTIQCLTLRTLFDGSALQKHLRVEPVFEAFADSEPCRFDLEELHRRYEKHLVQTLNFALKVPDGEDRAKFLGRMPARALLSFYHDRDADKATIAADLMLEAMAERVAQGRAFSTDHLRGAAVLFKSGYPDRAKALLSTIDDKTRGRWRVDLLNDVYLAAVLDKNEPIIEILQPIIEQRLKPSLTKGRGRISNVAAMMYLAAGNSR